MSITFMFHGDQPITERFDCMMCDIHGESEDCTECHGAGFVEFHHMAHGVNMSNANAWHVMKSLGFGDIMDYTGCLPTAEFHAALRAAMRHCRDPFLQERFDMLFKLVRAAERANDPEILWG